MVHPMSATPRSAYGLRLIDRRPCSVGAAAASSATHTRNCARAIGIASESPQCQIISAQPTVLALNRVAYLPH